MDQEQAKQRHKELTADGWERRFMAEEPRLTEMKESYLSLGLEVRIEPGAIGDDDDCKSCFNVEGFEQRYKTLYTRGAESAGARTDDELFD